MSSNYRKSKRANVIDHPIRVSGLTGADPVKLEGQGITITRVSAGLYKFTWAEDPGKYVNKTAPALTAVTPANLKDVVCVFEPYTSATRTMQMSVYRNGTLGDLVVNEFIAFTISFSESPL